MDQIGDEVIYPGSCFDDVTEKTNICFLQCRKLGFGGNAFIRDNPKRIIFLCQETFDYFLKNGEYQEAQNIITHELIHWIDLNRNFDFLDQDKLFCSEFRARILSGQCPDYYTGSNTLLNRIFNNYEQCALDGALSSMKSVDSKFKNWKPSQDLIEKCKND